MPVFLVFLMGLGLFSQPSVWAQQQDPDCGKIVGDLSLFQLKNQKNQQAHLNFFQQISERLRNTQSDIVNNVQGALEEKEKNGQKLTSETVTPLITEMVEPMSAMADDTDNVANAAYDNNETIKSDLDDLIKRIQNCLSAKTPASNKVTPEVPKQN